MARIAQSVSAMFLVTVFVAPLIAQIPTAEITGVVQDSAYRPLPDVEILARNSATGFLYHASSLSTGRYWLRGLPPGSYDITASRIGLRSATFRDVEIEVGRTVRLDCTLSLSFVELESITVPVGGSLIETTKAEISYVVDRERIQRIPEESRQFIELAQLVPGATAGTDATGGPPPFGSQGSTVGALNRQSLGILVDGGDFTEGVLGDLGGSLPLLAIQEFEVIQGQYAAELGRAASGIVNVVTRRGGNELRVEGLGLYRHEILNARGAFEDEKPDFNRSHWGVAAGGPIVPDRTHFFAAFERRVQNDFSTVNTGGAFPSFEGTFKTPLTDNLIFARIDHRASNAHELTLRYAGEIGQQLVGVGGRSAHDHGRNNELDMHGGLLTHRWGLGGAWLNEARLHVMDTQRSLSRNAPSGPNLVYPSLIAGPHVEKARLRTLRVELRNAISWITAGRTGTHRFKLGTQLSWLKNEVEQIAFENGRFVFDSDTASAPVFGLVSFEDAGLRLNERNLQLAFYVQNDWNPTSGLTLNLGLRYDVETNGSNQGFVSPFAGELPFIRTTPRPIDTDNLAPRIGVAWDPTGDGRTIVRGGFGVFYDALLAGPLLAFERSSGARTARIPNPGTINVDELMIDTDDIVPIIWAPGEMIETPMTRQYSVGLHHRLTGDLIVRVDGLLIQGRNLLLQRDLNPNSDSGPRFPEFASVFQILSEGRAGAKMLLIEARKSFSRGWLDIGYTLADRKNTNDTWSDHVPQTDPDNLDLDAEWGPAAWDERHRLVITGGIELPFDLGLVPKLIYASARPFTAITGRNDNGDFSLDNDRTPGEGRNARRGPDFFRADLGLRWTAVASASARIGLEINIYNLFNTTNGDPSSVQNNIQSPLFGQPLTAFNGRQAELGLRVQWK